MLQSLEAVDLSVRLSAAPGQAKAVAQRGAVCGKAGGKAFDNADDATTRLVQSGIKRVLASA